MQISKYKRAFIYFLINVALCALLFAFQIFFVEIFLVIPNLELSPLIPGDTQILEIPLVVLFLWPVASIIGVFIGSYLLFPGLLFVHRKIIGKNFTYGLVDIERADTFKEAFRGFFPALMAINLVVSYLLVDPIMAIIVTDEIRNNMGTMQYIVGLLVLLILTIGISMAGFSAVWALLEGGIVYSNEKIVEGSELPAEARALGSWYDTILKGYAGLSVFLSLYQLVFLFFEEISTTEWGFIFLIINIIVLMPLAIFIAFSALPALVLLDITQESRLNYIRKWAERVGIKDKVKFSYEKIES